MKPENYQQALTEDILRQNEKILDANLKILELLMHPCIQIKHELPNINYDDMINHVFKPKEPKDDR